MAYAQTLPISKTSLQKRDASNTGTITITGVVVDEITGEGIEYPTVALFSDSLKVIKAVAGGIDGRFIIEHIAPGSYFLSASMIGYTNSKDPLTIAGIDKKITKIAYRTENRLFFLRHAGLALTGILEITGRDTELLFECTEKGGIVGETVICTDFT